MPRNCSTGKSHYLILCDELEARFVEGGGRVALLGSDGGVVDVQNVGRGDGVGRRVALVPERSLREACGEEESAKTHGGSSGGVACVLRERKLGAGRLRVGWLRSFPSEETEILRRAIAMAQLRTGTSKINCKTQWRKECSFLRRIPNRKNVQKNMLN